MQQIGPYTVLGEIARGGHGVVFRARDAEGQVVALKLLLAHRAHSEHARTRFQLEVNALARMRHPHVVPILAAGEHEGSPWLALEFIDGESLETRLRRGPLPIGEATRIARQLAQALSYVHSCNVLHRDLKPDNVLLRDGQALLTDFGLALDADAEISRISASGAIQGTPGFWSPEQARGETASYGERTDVYGLGAVLYACLTGNPPVQATSLFGYMDAERFRQTPPPRALRPEVPHWLSELTLHCLAHDVDARPAAVEDVARALVVGPTDVPTTRRPPWRWLVAAVAALLVCLGLGLAVWVSKDSRRAQVELELARSAYDEARYAAVVEHCDRALALNPDLGLAWSFRGASRLRLGHNEAALSDLDRAVTLLPTHAPAYAERGACKISLGRRADAVDDYQRALELDPQSLSTRFELGSALSKLQRHEEALEVFDAAIELSPQNAYAYRSRGACKSNLGHDAAAVEDFDRSLELQPGDAYAYTNRGVSKCNMKLYAEALEDYDRALELDPHLAFAYGNKGVALTKLKRYAEAIADFDKALELEPGLGFVFYERALAKARSGLHAEAVEDFDRALKLDPRDAYAHRGRATCNAQLGLFAVAVADFDNAIRLTPGRATDLAGRGRSLANLGRNAEAIADFTAALELEPGSAETYADRGLSRDALRRFEGAFADYTQALKLGLSGPVAELVQRRLPSLARRLGRE